MIKHANYSSNLALWVFGTCLLFRFVSVVCVCVFFFFVIIIVIKYCFCKFLKTQHVHIFSFYLLKFDINENRREKVNLLRGLKAFVRQEHFALFFPSLLDNLL